MHLVKRTIDDDLIIKGMVHQPIAGRDICGGFFAFRCEKACFGEKKDSSVQKKYTLV